MLGSKSIILVSSRSINFSITDINPSGPYPQEDSDIETNDLEDNEDNYHQFFGASDDEVDFYGFSDEEEIGCPDECHNGNAQPAHKKKKKTDEHPDGWNVNKWKHRDHPLKPLPEFTGTPSINFDIPEDAIELYFFELFLTDELLEYLIGMLMIFFK